MVMRRQSAPVSSINGFDPYRAYIRLVEQSNVDTDTGYDD
jgi:hypothetical protein